MLNVESAGFCCGGGKEKPIVMPELPFDLVRLIQTNNELQKRSRAYNNLFSYTAVGTTGDYGFHHPFDNGVSDLILHGQTYHDERLVFVQYMYDKPVPYKILYSNCIHRTTTVGII